MAKQAEVSVGTVSNVLNRPSNVSEETRLKVRNAIDVLGLNQQNERSKLKKLFDHYLSKCAPSSWRESFKGAYSIAIFLKYLAYDDINEAYKVFREKNTKKSPY